MNNATSKKLTVRIQGKTVTMVSSITLTVLSGFMSLFIVYITTKSYFENGRAYRVGLFDVLLLTYFILTFVTGVIGARYAARPNKTRLCLGFDAVSCVVSLSFIAFMAAENAINLLTMFFAVGFILSILSALGILRKRHKTNLKDRRLLL